MPRFHLKINRANYPHFMNEVYIAVEWAGINIVTIWDDGFHIFHNDYEKYKHLYKYFNSLKNYK